MENMRISTSMEGLDREHDAPIQGAFRVKAPDWLNARDATDWVLDAYGTESDCIEVLGELDGQYQFIVTPKV